MNLIVRSTIVRFTFVFALFLMPFVIISQRRTQKPEVLYDHALVYMEGKNPETGEKLAAPDYSEAARLLYQAAVQDFAIAQRTLGDLHRAGKGVPEDKEEAMKWYRLAADKGDTMAQFRLGVMYDSGEGVPKDEKEAFKWFHRAAEGGELKAQMALATMYGGGHGTRKNTTEAVKWYRLAAEQGSSLAQYALGAVYEEGFDGVRSRKDAIEWYEKAAKQGMIEAKLALLRFSAPVALTAEEASANLIGMIVPQDILASREVGASGKVSVRIIIDRKGYVTDATFLSGPEFLSESALLTASELRYKPFLRDGQPVEGITTVSINF
jgi:TPR repeat protein